MGEEISKSALTGRPAREVAFVLTSSFSIRRNEGHFDYLVGGANAVGNHGNIYGHMGR